MLSILTVARDFPSREIPQVLYNNYTISNLNRSLLIHTYIHYYYCSVLSNAKFKKQF